MENEQTLPSYWNSVIIASLITAVIVTAFSLIGGYMTLGSEPTGSIFNTSQLFGTLGCLLGAVGGVFANWHYVKENNVTYKIGKGALIGLMVGLIATIFSVLISEIWNLIDPSYQEALIDWNIQNMEAMQIPAEAKEAGIESLEDAATFTGRLLQSLYILIGLCIMNVISGLIGAKVFASEE